MVLVATDRTACEGEVQVPNSFRTVQALSALIFGQNPRPNTRVQGEVRRMETGCR